MKRFTALSGGAQGGRWFSPVAGIPQSSARTPFPAAVPAHLGHHEPCVWPQPAPRAPRRKRRPRGAWGRRLGPKTSGLLAALLITGAAHAGESREDTAPLPPPRPTSIELTPEPTPPSEWGVDGPYRLDLHFRIGGGGRLDAPPAYTIDDVGGLLLGVGMGLALSPRIALGLTYEHLALGSERSSVLSSGVVNIVRETHTGWLDMKLYPFRTDDLGIYLSVAAGLSVQGADLTASLWLPESPGTNVSYFCGATDDPGFALQGALGFDVVVGPGVRFMLESGIANHRLSDQIIDGCAPGAGTMTVFAARGGVGYAWDL